MSGDEGSTSWREQALAEGALERWDDEAARRAGERQAGTGPPTNDCLISLDLKVFDAMAEIVRESRGSGSGADPGDGGASFGSLLSAHADVGLGRVLAPPSTRERRGGERRDGAFTLVELLARRLAGPGAHPHIEVLLHLDATLVERLDAKLDATLGDEEDRWLLDHRDKLHSVAVELGLRSRAILTGHLPHELHGPPRPGGPPQWRRRPR